MTDKFSPAFEAGMDARVGGAALKGDGDGVLAQEWRDGWNAADAVLRKARPIHKAPTNPWEKVNENTNRLLVPGGWVYTIRTFEAAVAAAVFVPRSDITTVLDLG